MVSLNLVYLNKTLQVCRAMSRISRLRNDMNKRTFYKERKINNRSFDSLSKQNIIVPLILDINDFFKTAISHGRSYLENHYSYIFETWQNLSLGSLGEGAMGWRNISWKFQKTVLSGPRPKIFLILTVLGRL